MANNENKKNMVDEIIKDICLGIFPKNPCEHCNAGEEGYCYGCPAADDYYEELTSYRDVLGEEALTEAIAVGKLESKITELQEDIVKHQKKLEKFISPKYEEMVKKRAEVTAYFEDIVEKGRL